MAATANRDLAAGEILDGEGGFTVYGKLLPARASLERRALPIGLANGVALKRAIEAGKVVRWQDVEIDPCVDAVKARREMEDRLAGVQSSQGSA